MLPNSPTDGEKYLYVKQNRAFFYWTGVPSFLALVTGMTYFSLQHPYTSVYLLFVFVTSIYLGISYFIGVMGKPFSLEVHNKIKEENKNYEPTIDVYLPCCGEPLEVLENTYKHVALLNWNKEKLKVYILDDKGLDAIKSLAEKYGFFYISRENKGYMKKAGNMRHAFPLTNGDLITIYDADFCPRPDFLKELTGYFNHDDKIAIVQTPQFFSVEPDQNWIEKGAGYIQELFYRLVQVNRNRWDASVCVGSNAVYRRKSLEPFGGTAEIGYSEDLHTGFTMLENGMKVRYVPLNLAKGICPDTIATFFMQQYRWCMGSTTLMLNPRFWKSPLSFMQKLSYLTGKLYYTSTAFSVFVNPIPSLIMVWAFPEELFWFNVLFSLPSLIFGMLVVPIWQKAPWGWYGIKTRMIANHAHVFAIWDKIKNSAVAWVPSGDNRAAKKVSRISSFRNLLFYWTSIWSFGTLIGAALNMKGWQDYNYYPTVALTIFNYWLMMTILKDQE
jgi:cellulose synthase/poly-beta-1,6-N-acetylglucosamine synthase-like glycosyltransferase